MLSQVDVKETVARRFIHRHVPGKTDEEPDADKINFQDVVDWNEYLTEQYLQFVLVKKLLDSVVFKSITMIVIIIAAITVGLETNEDLALQYSKVFTGIEQCVLTYYVIEVGLKWYYNFYMFWMDSWNVLDFVLIAIAVFVPHWEFVGGLRILHIIRYTQEMYAITDFKLLRGMVIVSRGILLALPPLVDILLLFVLTLVILSTVAVIVLGEFVPKHYGYFSLTVFNVFSTITNEVWSQIHYEVRRHTDTMMFCILVIFNLAVIFLGTFFVRGLCLATLHSNLELAIAQVEAEEEARADQRAKTKAEEISNARPYEKYKMMTLGSSATTETESILRPNVATLWFEKLFRDKNYTQQHCEITDLLKNLTSEKIENYYMVLIALNDNFEEYIRIRKDLERLIKVVCELQLTLPADEMGKYRYGKEKIRLTGLTDEVRAKLLANREQLEIQRLLISKIGDRETLLSPITKMKDERPDHIKYTHSPSM